MPKNNQHDDDELFDFGFTAVSEDELEATQAAAAHAETNEGLRTAIDKLYNSVLPLLANLEKDPEKDYIYWPNRTDKIADFRRRITDIYNTSKQQ